MPHAAKAIWAWFASLFAEPVPAPAGAICVECKSAAAVKSLSKRDHVCSDCLNKIIEW
jgi:hypothetical protein